MRINSNTAAFNAYRNLSINDGMLSKSLEKLSSGFRVNRAADDAAGLVKSESLRSDIRGLGQAVKNAQDGISFVQTAEGALVEVHSILQRMNELAVSAANTATSDGVAEQAELEQLRTQLGEIGSQTRFAGIDVFSADEQTFHIGSAAGETIGITTGVLTTASVGSDAIDISGLDLAAAGGADTAIDTIRDAIASVSTTRGDLGAIQNRLETTVRNLQVSIENLSASESRIRDTDMAAEMANFTRNQIMMQAGTSMLAQANAVPQNVLALLR
ncbi:MAG: flagellin [Acidimicrobiales bacterium]